MSGNILARGDRDNGGTARSTVPTQTSDRGLRVNIGVRPEDLLGTDGPGVFTGEVEITEAFAGLDRIREILNMKTEDDEDARREPIREVRGEVAFEGVSFRCAVELLRVQTGASGTGEVSGDGRGIGSGVVGVAARALRMNGA